MARSQILKLKGHCLPTYSGCTWIFKMCLWTKGTSGVKFIYTVTGVTIVQRTLLTKSKDNILKALQYLIVIKWYDIALNIAFYLLWVKKKLINIIVWKSDIHLCYSDNCCECNKMYLISLSMIEEINTY